MSVARRGRTEMTVAFDERAKSVKSRALVPGARSPSLRGGREVLGKDTEVLLTLAPSAFVAIRK